MAYLWRLVFLTVWVRLWSEVPIFARVSVVAGVSVRTISRILSPLVGSLTCTDQVVISTPVWPNCTMQHHLCSLDVNPHTTLPAFVGASGLVWIKPNLELKTVPAFKSIILRCHTEIYSIAKLYAILNKKQEKSQQITIGVFSHT